MFNFYIYIKNKKKLIKLAQVLSKIYFSGFIIYTIGKVGIGKTNFIKSFLGEILNYKFDIKSPTYSLIEDYISFNIIFYHFDLFRIQPNDLINLDLNNYLNKNSILLIEWGNKLTNKLFFAHLYIFFFNYSHSFNRFILLKSPFINIQIILVIPKQFLS